MSLTQNAYAAYAFAICCYGSIAFSKGQTPGDGVWDGKANYRSEMVFSFDMEKTCISITICSDSQANGR